MVESLGKFARQSTIWTSVDGLRQTTYIYSLGGCRSVPSVAPTRDRLVRAKNGTAARVHARACCATRFQPLRNKSSEENLPEGINVGVGSPRVFCPPSRAERVKLLPPRHPYRASPERHVLPRDLLVWIYPTDERAILLCERLKWNRGTNEEETKWEITEGEAEGGRKRMEAQDGQCQREGNPLSEVAHDETS